MTEKSNDNVIALVPDAFGGRGGIALYDRLLLRAICNSAQGVHVTALPRNVCYELEAMPSNLQFLAHQAGSKTRFLIEALSIAARIQSARLVVCGHLHLLPIAKALSIRFDCPLLTVIYGREAWTQTPHSLVNYLSGRLEYVAYIRKYTFERFCDWARPHGIQGFYLPNAIELTRYGVGRKRPDLVARFGLESCPVVMTTGRIELESAERNKGFDEVLEALPLIAEAAPDIKYLVMGDGDGQGALAEKAQALNVSERVIFCGYVAEQDKADYYRLADVVAMPGSNPLFDRYPFRFAFLEPLACGIPVVASKLEDPSEQNDPAARALLIQVDPASREDIARGVIEGLARKAHRINPILHEFDYAAFEQRVRQMLCEIQTNFC